MNVAPQPPLIPGTPPPPTAGAAAVGLPQAHANTAPSTFAELYRMATAIAHTGIYGPVLTLFTAHPAAG